MEARAATHFSGGHADDVDYVSWNPTHPELFCTSSQKDRRIVFWDARREFGVLYVHYVQPLQNSRKSAYAANSAESLTRSNELFSGRQGFDFYFSWTPAFFLDIWERW